MTMFRLLHLGFALCAILSCTVVCGHSSSEDTFVCKKTEATEDATNDRELGQDHKIEQLERRIEELEETLAMIPAVAPEVISLTYNSIPRDCSELYDHGERTSGVYQISPDGRCPFNVYCDMNDGGWTTIQRRQSADLDFRRNWDEYTSGFGDLQDDFWLGLDKIHRLTQGGSRIQFLLGRYGKTNQIERALDNSFIVHDVISGYTMNVDAFGYSGTIPELFGNHDGARFSTFDRDQDMYSGSCSEEFGAGGGWWYNSCYRLGILNGKYGKKAKGGNAYWDTQSRYIKNTEIKIKPMVGGC